MENVKIIASTLKSITLMTLEALFINDIKLSLNTKDKYRSRALVIKFQPPREISIFIYF